MYPPALKDGSDKACIIWYFLYSSETYEFRSYGTCEKVTGNVLSVVRTVVRTDREHNQLKKVIDIL
jgi:hypothetical protein